ncbi:MAG: Rne/Rng family ribonuclease [Acidimicrobiales bacterium]
MNDTPDTGHVVESQPASGGSGPTIRRRRIVTQDQKESSADTEARADKQPPEPQASPDNEAAQAGDSGEAPRKRTRRISGASKPRTPRGAGAKPAPNASEASEPAPRDTTDQAQPGEDAKEAAAKLPPLPPAATPKPRIGDSRPAPAGAADGEQDQAKSGEGSGQRRRRRGGRGRGRGKPSQAAENGQKQPQGGSSGQRQGGRGGASRKDLAPVEATLVDDAPVELDEAELQRRRGRERKGRPAGRYQMAVHVHGDVTHIAVLEGRSLIEHYVSRPADDVSQIHGNIYLGRVQNVLPGMEAAFVDIGTPKNAVLYRGDVTFDQDDLDSAGPSPAKGRKSRKRPKDGPRIEDLLKAKQAIICQVTKNPIGHKGARLTTEVSLPGRFVVMVPNSATYGISKRLPDKERKRLRSILDRIKPEGHGLIVRTAAEGVTAEEIERDVARLAQQWTEIERLAGSAKAPALLFREPDMAVRVIREEFSKEYRGVIIDDRALYEQVKGYMETVTPALADRIEFHDPKVETLPLFERFHVAEQFRRAIDRKVWLPSGGSLIIEHTEALTVIDVNTGKNVGSSNLEETVFSNNLEAAEEIAKQLRLRDIGGIIVIDFIDMEVKKHRDEVMRVFRDALARDKTRTQAYDITDLGLVEMTRKRIGEGLLESVTSACEQCEGRGIVFQDNALPK